MSQNKYHVAIISLPRAYIVDRLDQNPWRVPRGVTAAIEAIDAVFLDEDDASSLAAGHNRASIAGVAETYIEDATWAVVVGGRVPSPGDVITLPDAPQAVEFADSWRFAEAV